MSKIIETYRTTKELRQLVRRAAKIEHKLPSEFLRGAAEEKARAVIRENDRKQLRKLLAEMATGKLTDDEAAQLGNEIKSELRGQR